MPSDDDLAALQEIVRAGHMVDLLTSRHDEIRTHTRAKIPEVLPGIVRNIHFSSNIHTMRSSGRSKKEILADLHADAFAEDNLHYALDCADVVEVVYLFRHPWNRDYSRLPSNIVEVDDWPEAATHFLSSALR